AGMDDYLSKPFEEDELRSVLARWLKTSPEPVPVREAPAEPQHAQTLDARTLERIRKINGDALLHEVITLYLADSPALLRELIDGLSQPDPSMRRRAAHALKASSANMGALRLAKLCEEILVGARDGTPVRESMQSELTLEYELVAGALEELVRIQPLSES